MSTMTLLSEQVDRRVLAAFVCVDAMTGAIVTRGLQVNANPSTWTLRPNRSGIYVVFDGPGLSAQTNQFIPSGTWPAAVSFEVSLRDPMRSYLPRRATIKAPMSVPVIAVSTTVPNAEVAAALSDPSTIFDPQRVAIYPAANATTGTNWAVMRVSVTQTGTAKGIPWAVVRITKKSDGSLLASGVTDINGEALLAVMGITQQANTSGTGPVMVSTLDVIATAYVDPNTIIQPPDWISDPDDVLGHLADPSIKTTSQQVQLAAGRELPLSFSITL